MSRLIRCGHCRAEGPTLDSVSQHIARVHPPLPSPPRGSGSSWSADDVAALRLRARFAYVPTIVPPSAPPLYFTT